MGDADVLRSLYEWLQHEDEFRGRVRLEQPAPKPGEMGAVPEVLAVVLGSGGAGTVLARSLFTWLGQRRSDVKLSVTTSEGRKVELEAQRVSDVQSILQEFERLLRNEDTTR